MMERDFFMGAQEAKEKGIVDEILERRGQEREKSKEKSKEDEKKN
jgi:ATP-dependent protease ClpP protease subunit